MKTKYDKNLLQSIVLECSSISQVLEKLKLKPSGGNHSHISKLIKHYEINTSHFKGQAWNKGKTLVPKNDINDYLSNNKFITSDRLKKRLINEGFFDPKCQNCNLNEWMGQQIPLELHHKDENHSNNNLSNLELLCPNCHSLIHKNINTKIKEDKKNNISKKEKERKKLPRPKTRKVERPTYEQLKKDLLESNYSQVAKKYGVSDNCIRKWIKLYSSQDGI